MNNNIGLLSKFTKKEFVAHIPPLTMAN